MDNYKNEDINYVRKEAETLYDSMFLDDEVLNSRKQVYAMIYNNMEMIFGCQKSDFDSLYITRDEIKEIIKEVVDTNKRQLTYKK